MDDDDRVTVEIGSVVHGIDRYFNENSYYVLLSVDRGERALTIAAWLKIGDGTSEISKYPIVRCDVSGKLSVTCMWERIA